MVNVTIEHHCRTITLNEDTMRDLYLGQEYGWASEVEMKSYEEGRRLSEEYYNQADDDAEDDILSLGPDYEYALAKGHLDYFKSDFLEKFEDEARQHPKSTIWCRSMPVISLPLLLNLAVNGRGEIYYSMRWLFPSAESYCDNPYLHINRDKTPETVIVTEEMRAAVSGLFSGRIILPNGMKVSVGGTVQDICVIDLKGEEKLLGKTIPLSMIIKGR